MTKPILEGKRKAKETGAHSTKPAYSARPKHISVLAHSEPKKLACVLERNGIVYTKVVEDVSAKTLMQVIEEKTEKGSVYYTDCFKSYKSLTRFGKHNRINKQHAWAKGRNHINGIEGFWSFAKERFHKYNEFLKEFVYTDSKAVRCIME